MRSGSSVQRQITGNQEKPDFTRVPSYNEICFNEGKALAPKKIIQKIDDWISNQLERIDEGGVTMEVVLKTLKLRNEWAGTEYTLEEWKTRSQNDKQKKSYCEDNCTVSLRL